jgi:hypothetical protein
VAGQPEEDDPLAEAHCDVEVWGEFREIAMILTQMPASEAAAERPFSLLRHALRKTRVSASPDIPEATLALRSLQIYHAPDEVVVKAPSALPA